MKRLIGIASVAVTVAACSIASPDVAPACAAAYDPPPAGSGFTGHYYHAGVGQAIPPDRRDGVGGRIRISDPVMRDRADQVTNELAVVKGANESLVEVGYHKFWVDAPELLVGRWADGKYLGSEGFVSTHPTYKPDMSLRTYIGRAVPFFINHRAGAWWVWFDNAWIGNFPDSLWRGSFTHGDQAHWYGEVYSAAGRNPPQTQMGNGIRGDDTHAESIDGMCLYADERDCRPISKAQTYVTDHDLYPLTYDGCSSQRHGGPGLPLAPMPKPGNRRRPCHTPPRTSGDCPEVS